MKLYIKLFTVSLAALIFSGCSDEFKDDLVRDNKPEVPVTFEGATTTGFNPYYTVSQAAGTFTITLKIPENSPSKIKQISKVVAGNTSINVASLSGTSGQYFAAPIDVNDYSYTFTTSVAYFDTKVPASARIVSNALPAGSTFKERAFMFQLLMDDDSIIIPVQLRLRVTLP